MTTGQRWARAARLVLIPAAVVALAGTISQAAQASTAEKAGAAVVVDPSGQTLNSGGSATPFTLELPAGAACPGDTYHRGYLVYSYVAPAGTDPADLSFAGTFPSSGLDLITSRGVPFVTQATAEFTGAIQALPDFSWQRYDHDTTDLPPGPYNVGIACAEGEGKVVKYWNVPIVLTADSRDAGGFTWQATNPKADPAPHHGDTGPLMVALIVVIVILAGGLALVLRRRSTVSPTAPR
jgi:hypothetical protein